MLRLMNMCNKKDGNLLQMGINVSRMGFDRGQVTFSIFTFGAYYA